jgi:hypothetical protein
VTDWPLHNHPSSPADYSDAIGQIFSPEASYGDGGTTPYPRLAPDQSDQVTSDTALTFQATANVDLGGGGLVSTSQEFAGVGSRSKPVLLDDPLPVPEGSIITFLVFDLLALPVVVFLMRRRTRRDA